MSFVREYTEIISIYVTALKIKIINNFPYV